MQSARLETLLTRIRACRICVEEPAGTPLPHEPRPVVVGSRSARILIAGQAPGTRVHASGLPFDDRSGDRLRDWLEVDRPTFYDPSCFAIAPMGFCFPGLDAKGGDLPPRRECAPAWRAQLMEAMPQIELVLVIGQYAQAWHLGGERSRTLTETVRDWRRLLALDLRPRVLPLPHPSWRNTGWLKKNLWFERDLLPVLREEIHRLLSDK
ncbi:uracil-DNA glycosylase family protein [Nitratireductor rhodophyticola]|uniref:uracil-DNA glycosylase family protein n=1 Tax=Nitratireductor rhodophyticola TaxID=2854036 RepID=UPI002AC96289|nr:uracil-DNA glycosylase family protein [Nitratireductor rhodophyticola]WPZ13369.1 uracil-DNA glycosylase family protein [Nitratireductor rhodophyticola]